MRVFTCERKPALKSLRAFQRGHTFTGVRSRANARMCFHATECPRRKACRRFWECKCRRAFIRVKTHEGVCTRTNARAEMPVERGHTPTGVRVTHMTIPTLAGSDKATSSWTMVDRASISLALKARVLGTFAGLRLEYHPYDGVDDFAIISHSYLRAPPAHDVGDEAFWRSSGGEALLAVTGSGLLYSSVYDLRASSSPTSNAGLVYDGRPKTKRKLPLKLASSSQEQPDDDDDDDIEEIEERPAESEEEEAAVSKKRKAKGTAAGGGRQKPNAAKGKSRATSRQPKAKRMADDKDPDITESEVDVEPEPPARTTRSRSRPAATPAAAAPVPAPEPAPGQTGGGPPRGRSQTGNVLPCPVARVKRQVAVSPEELSRMDGNVASSATRAVEDETFEGLKKTVQFADDAAQAKRGPDGSTPQPPNKRRRAADESSTTPTAPVALHSTATPAPHMGLAALISGATPPPPPVAFPGASSSVGLPGLPPGMPPPSRVPAPPFAAASVATPPSSGVDRTVQAMSQLMATLSDEQRAQFLQQMGFGAR
ncbi:hypothetical protein GGX14DRAFT_404384 [Mycena pura]|uniref:Uncharacterized protein n=1 Tax=Mycena pura TaxID=153505 RepID=A0AAD6Y1K5_9AGAR|nr:hypothetical protein GGX14DRAFT_404384 [Mycena pura]